MKEIELPASRESQRKKCASLKRTGAFYTVCTVGSAVLAVLLLLGTFITVIVSEFRNFANETLFYALIGSFAGGAVVFALAAFGSNLLAQRHRKCELDFRERCDGAESFFVGEGTLATFGETGIVIHGEEEGGERVRVPYSEMRFFSVCTRRAPRERGEWSVIFEIPARYLAKEGRAPKDGAPALVQTDAKPRLYQTLERHGLECTGERESGGKGKFALRAKFYLPDRSKRKRALITIVAGLVFTVGGALLGVFWQVTVGALVGAVGVLFAVRSLFAYMRAKSMLGVCDEGLWWQDINRVDSVFLKWEEIMSIACEPNNGSQFYRVQCAYGAYHFPAVEGSLAVLKELHPEKFGEEKCGN